MVLWGRLLILALLVLGYPSVRAQSFSTESFTKKLAWAAAHADNPGVLNQFQEYFKQAPASLWQSAEGQELRKQAHNLLAVAEIQEQLSKCLVEHEVALSARQALAGALTVQSRSLSDCVRSLSSLQQLQVLGSQLNDQRRKAVQGSIIGNAKSNVSQTERYWSDVKKSVNLETALQLTLREQEFESLPPSQGMELLLYTKALRDRPQKDFVTRADIHNGIKEVFSELGKQKEYLAQQGQQDAAESVLNMVATNPVAVAQHLLKNPQDLDVVCEALTKLDQKSQRRESWDKAVLWGGLIVGGVLIATGVGAGLGALVLSGTAAAGVALVGTVTAGGGALYSSSRAHESYIEMQNLRSSAYAENQVTDGFAAVQREEARAYEQMADAGFAAASIIPFGIGLRTMQKVAQASKLGSLERVASQGRAVSQSVNESLAQMFKEVSRDPATLRALEGAQKTVSPEEMGIFLGYLSDLPSSQRQRVLELIKAKPERVSTAIKASKSAGVCK